MTTVRILAAAGATAFAFLAFAGAREPVPENVPELLVTTAGRKVAAAADWEKLRRPELLRIFETEVYGTRPMERPADLRFETVVENPEALGGTAVMKRVKISFSGAYGAREFVVTAFFPKSAVPAPVFLYAGIQGDAPGLNSHRHAGDGQVGAKFLDERWPVQKILERGYATVAFQVTQLADDDYDAFKAGVYPVFQKAEDRTAESWGALSAWAWGASRVLDWIETETLADARRVAVVGLSRGGKTALWAGATDTRFAMACSSGSGCCGAKLNHIELQPANDEHIARILRFRHWFCRNFDNYSGKDLTMPFDQHEMIALIAPRLVCIASATDDDGAGPLGEYYGALLASPAWELYGKKGLVANAFPPPETPLQEGSLSYHVRRGGHDLMAYDWSRFMEFADKHGWRAGAGK